jgi:hypothetical protein
MTMPLVTKAAPRLAVAVIACCGVVGALPSPARAASAPFRSPLDAQADQAAANPRPAFEVASIKPNAQGFVDIGNACPTSR